MVLNWIIWALALSLIIGALVLFLRRQRSRPVHSQFKSQLRNGKFPFDCATCGKQGVINPTMPTRVLSLNDQLAMVNQDTCPCCHGLCVHWRTPGNPPKCIKFKAKGPQG